ncbi:MAG: hypothetical protein MUO26_10105 [Methanotrichaceae archaeon]|nr:hypothetical protein [Methanotrichaceae archaeon]
MKTYLNIAAALFMLILIVPLLGDIGESQGSTKLVRPDRPDRIGSTSASEKQLVSIDTKKY